MYIYIYGAVLKRLTTPSDFHIPLLSIYKNDFLIYTHKYIFLFIYIYI